MILKKIAVFIPCYNSAGTIRQTVESVIIALDNSSYNIPVYIYDDCSTDNTYQVADMFQKEDNRIILRRNRENIGERKTTNTAFAELKQKFEWIFVIHADDIVKKDWLMCSIEWIQKVDDDKYFTIWSSYDTLNDATNEIIEGDNSGFIQNVKRTDEQIRGYLTKLYSSWHISGAAFNLSLFESIGGFDVSMAQFGDTDFFVRGLMKNYRDIYICHTLTFYRISTNSVTNVSIRTNRDIKEIFILINKHRSLLLNKDVDDLYGHIRKLSWRRAIKNFVNFHFKAAFDNARIFYNSFLIRH